MRLTATAASKKHLDGLCAGPVLPTAPTVTHQLQSDAAQTRCDIPTSVSVRQLPLQFVNRYEKCFQTGCSSIGHTAIVMWYFSTLLKHSENSW